MEKVSLTLTDGNDRALIMGIRGRDYARKGVC